jgi:hypothetical protein
MNDGDEPILGVHMRPFRSASVLMVVALSEPDVRLVETKKCKGGAIAEIKNNEWSHQPRPAIFDCNYANSSILEIRDATTGRISLQLVDLGETVCISGTFICSHSGWTYTVGHGVIRSSNCVHLERQFHA